MNQQDLIVEFVLQASKSEGPISFGHRSDRRGYTKVFGPSANPRQAQSCHISIEHSYPAVSVSSTLAPLLGAKPRRGWSSGPNGGRFQHDILLSEADLAYGSPEAFVRELVKVAKHQRVW